MYYDVSTMSTKTNGTETGPNNGTGFDIKRFYVGIDHKFTDMFSANITTDFQYSSAIGATEVYIKKAYLQAAFSPALTVRAGSTDMPWIPYAEGIYGYRYVENTVSDRQKVGTSADWGLHALGTLPGGVFSYQVSVVNGNGYKNPTRSKTMDIEGRLSAKLDQWNFAVGGYTGKLGQSVVGTATPNTASRFNALAAWIGDQGRLGVEYFSANDYSAALVKGPATTDDKAEGYSVFGTYRLNHDWALFGRADDVKPSKKLTPSKKDRYFNAGVTYSAFKNVDFSLVLKHDDLTSPGTKVVNNEIGVFAQFLY